MLVGRQTMASQEKSNVIIRSEDGVVKNISVEAMNEETGRTDKISIKVEPYLNQDSHSKEVLKRTAKKIEQVLLGENESYEQVNFPLFLLQEIKEDSLSLEWVSSKEEYINNQGVVFNEELKERVEVLLTCNIYEHTPSIPKKRLGSYKRVVVVNPKSEYEHRIWLQRLEEEIAKKEIDTRGKKQFELPQESGGESITWTKREKNDATKIILIGCFVCIACYFGIDGEIERKSKERQQQMMQDYPQIVNKFTLLIGAGMTTLNAWRRILADYENTIDNGALLEEKEGKQRSKQRRFHTIKKKRKEKRYVYEEMSVALRQISYGVSESTAILEFGEKTGLSTYMKFTTVLVQNLKKGNEGLTSILKDEVEEAFNQRLQTAKKLGEEASTKLLIPMMFMFVIVLTIILVPALWSMQL